MFDCVCTIKHTLVDCRQEAIFIIIIIVVNIILVHVNLRNFFAVFWRQYVARSVQTRIITWYEWMDHSQFM